MSRSDDGSSGADDVDAFLADQRRTRRKTTGLFGTGVATVLVGVGLLVASWLQMRISWWGLLSIAAGAGLMMLALTLARGGFSARRRAPRTTTTELRGQVEAASTPFWVCTRCRTLSAASLDGRCPACESLAECIEVRSEDDRGIALAALEG